MCSHNMKKDKMYGPIKRCCFGKISTDIGKVCYDKKTAVTAANKRYKDDHTKLRVYECLDCSYWHLTHLEKWQ